MTDLEETAAQRTHIMIDLETLGTKPGCAILSIGAVKFDPLDPYTSLNELDKFHVRITPGSLKGMSSDPETVSWWFDPERDAARAALQAVPWCDLYSALDGLTSWAHDGTPAIDAWWGNSAAFDLGILAAAYEHVGLETPWPFWRERCYRTIKSCFRPVDLPFDGVAHTALDDAIHQVKMLRHLYGHGRMQA